MTVISLSLTSQPQTIDLEIITFRPTVLDQIEVSTYFVPSTDRFR
jgi:hypothetical protein